VTGHGVLAELRFGPRGLDGLVRFSWGLLVAELVEVVASILTVVVLLSITSLQERRRVMLDGLATPQFAALP
jgi:hypothetical protein